MTKRSALDRMPRPTVILAALFAVAILISGCSYFRHTYSVDELVTEMERAINKSPDKMDKNVRFHVRKVSGIVRSTSTDEGFLYVRLGSSGDAFVECGFSDEYDPKMKKRAEDLKAGQQVTFSGELLNFDYESTATPKYVFVSMNKCEIL